MIKRLRTKIIKYALYFLLLFFAYIIQATPGLLDYYGAKAMLVIPVCVCIAVCEGELAGGIFGFLAGLFCDSSASTVFGFNAFVLTAFCAGIGLAAIYLFRRSSINVMLVGFGTIFARAFGEYFFSYMLYGYENIRGFFYWELMPEAVFTSLFILPYYFLIKYIHTRLEPEVPTE